MEKLTKNKLDQLLLNTATPAVTIYLPIHVSAAPPHINENQIRLKNLLHRAADQVKNQSLRLAQLLETKINEMHDNLSFWEAQTPGLLVCATPEEIRLFHLPIETDEYLSIDERFHLAPLIGLLHDEHDFYVLALAQHQPKLYKGDLYELAETSLNLPANIKDALGIDEANQKSENQGTSNRPSTMAGVGKGHFGGFNGRGGARDPREADRFRYWRMLDRVVYDHTDHILPLVLAGIEAEIAEYRSISKLPNLTNGHISGNHTHDNLRSLFESAQNIIWQELVMADHKAAVDEFNRIKGANPARAIQDITKVEQAAEQGRVDKLLAKMVSWTADTVRDSALSVPKLIFPEKQASRALNEIALEVWQSSGTVYNLEASEMPDGALIAARLRY